jgi:hypothetical protein
MSARADYAFVCSSKCQHGRHCGEEAGRSDGNRPEWTAKVVRFRRLDAKLGIGTTVLCGWFAGSLMLLCAIRESMRGSVIDAMGRKRSG